MITWRALQARDTGSCDHVTHQVDCLLYNVAEVKFFITLKVKSTFGIVSKIPRRTNEHSIHVLQSSLW